MAFKILVAVDGSESARRAATWLARREARGDSQITIWMTFDAVIPAPFMWDAGPVGLSALPDEKLEEAAIQLTEKERAHGEEVVDDVHREMAKQGVQKSRMAKRVQERVFGHDVASLILAAYHDGRFDEVVIGRRGLGRFKEWLLGSVSNRIVHHMKDGAVTVVG